MKDNPVPPAAKNYFVRIGEQESGPFSETQLRHMWLAGALTGGDRYVEEGSQNWRPLSGLREKLEHTARIEARKIEMAAEPLTLGNMIAFGILAFFVPLVGFIAGPIWMRQPGKKRDQGINLIAAAVVGAFCYFGFSIFIDVDEDRRRQEMELRKMHLETQQLMNQLRP
jgi:hypothetical protein